MTGRGWQLLGLSGESLSLEDIFLALTRSEDEGGALMRHALAIARREIESYFVSPIAYAVMTIFTFVSGLFFSNMLVYYIRQAAMADAQIQKFGCSEHQLDVPTVVLAQFFQNEAFLLMLAIPLLTMGLITDERRKGHARAADDVARCGASKSRAASSSARSRSSR